MRRWERVIEVADRLLRLNPQMTDVQFHRAVANFNLGNVAMAKQLALDIRSGTIPVAFHGSSSR